MVARLPIPGTSSFSWGRLYARLKNMFIGLDLSVTAAFWLFGLVNNILYVVILSAALDIVGSDIPKATILLASIVPSLLTKLVTPYFIHVVPYSLRIIIFVALSTCGMLAVALTPDESIGLKVAGIVLANVSSGAGEVNFLSLTHYFGTSALAAWGSGTGGAGLIGAGAYAVLTTKLNLSVRTTLLISALLPVIMLVSYFILLPRGLLQSSELRTHKDGQSSRMLRDESPREDRETAGLLDQDEQIALSIPQKTTQTWFGRLLADMRTKINRSKALVLPYMLPLFLVYLAEYTINQGVAPMLLFSLSSTPFEHYRDFYPSYAALYQAGVFISRSSLAFFQIRSLYLPSFLQIGNLLALTAHAMYPFLPTVYFVFAVVFWEGLLGGLVYVSTYAAVKDEIVPEEREFSLAAVSIGDAGGIFVAGLLGIVMEPALCGWQVRHGRDWCRQP